MTDLLKDSLGELAERLQPFGIRLTIVGGYGLVLRVEAVQASGVQTLGGPAPVSRSTEDIDCFLGTAIITDGMQTQRIRTVLDDLGYVAATEHYLFTRTVTTEHATLTLRLDLMAAPIRGELANRVKIKHKRIRPTTYDGLHGQITPEAEFIEDQAMAIDISPDKSGLMVNLPQAFPYLVMKLFALRDGPTSKDPTKARRHALDMFTIWATMTEPELIAAEALREKYETHPLMVQVRAITAELFEGRDPAALLSMRIAARESGILLDEALIPQFTDDILSLLGNR